MKVGVVVFPGSNCDRDMYHVLTDVFHLDAEYYWHEKGLPENIDAVILPGGFSYGDRLRAGVIAAHSPIIKDVQKMAEKAIPIANGEGRYYVDDDTMKELKKKNQIVFRYSEVVNGSSDRIAGVCNEDGNVVGMMPHPERAVESEINPLDNKPSSLIFESLLTKMGVNK